VNPSFLGLLDFCGDRYPVLFDGRPWLPPLLWIFYSPALVVFSRNLLRRAWQSEDLVYSLMIAVLLYALLIPRFMVYSYLLLIPPILLLVLPRVGRLRGDWTLVVLLCLPGLWQLPERWGDIVVSALPFVFSLAGWCFLVRVDDDVI
jgi:hypothetical protein